MRLYFNPNNAKSDLTWKDALKLGKDQILRQQGNISSRHLRLMDEQRTRCVKAVLFGQGAYSGASAEKKQELEMKASSQLEQYASISATLNSATREYQNQTNSDGVRAFRIPGYGYLVLGLAFSVGGCALSIMQGSVQTAEGVMTGGIVAAVGGVLALSSALSLGVSWLISRHATRLARQKLASVPLELVETIRSVLPARAPEA